LLSCCGGMALLTIRRTCWVRPGPSLRDLISILAEYPAPRRWAKVARPSGTLVRPACNLIFSRSIPNIRKGQSSWTVRGRRPICDDGKPNENSRGCVASRKDTPQHQTRESPEGEPVLAQRFSAGSAITYEEESWRDDPGTAFMPCPGIRLCLRPTHKVPTPLAKFVFLHPVVSDFSAF